MGGQGMRRNPQVVISDHCALRFQICANRSVGLCRRFRQRERRKHADEFSEALQSRSALRTFICPVEQLSKSNYRKRRLSARSFGNRRRTSGRFSRM